MLAALFRSRIRLLFQPAMWCIALLVAVCSQEGCSTPNPGKADKTAAYDRSKGNCVHQDTPTAVFTHWHISPTPLS